MQSRQTYKVIYEKSLIVETACNSSVLNRYNTSYTKIKKQNNHENCSFYYLLGYNYSTIVRPVTGWKVKRERMHNIEDLYYKQVNLSIGEFAIDMLAELGQPQYWYRVRMLHTIYIFSRCSFVTLHVDTYYLERVYCTYSTAWVR